MDPIISCALNEMVKSFEEADICEVHAGQGRKKKIPQMTESVTTAVVEQANSNTAGTCSARVGSR